MQGMWKMMIRAGMIVLLTACNLSPVQEQAIATPTVFRLAQASLIAPVRDLHAAPSPPTAPTDSPTQQGDAPRCASRAIPRHTAEITLNYREKRADVRQTIALANPLSQPTETLVFNVEANRTPGAFILRSAAADRDLDGVEVVGRQITLDLTAPLDPGCLITVTFSYGLNIPAVAEGSAGRTGYFGFSNRQVNLGHALITLAHHREDAWATYNITVIGEQITSAIADWSVRLSLTDAPTGVTLAAPGLVERLEPNIWQITSLSSREVAFSLSPFFRRAEAISEQGTLVEVYSFDNAVVDTPAGRVDGAEQVLTAATQSLSMFSDLFGMYRDPRFVVVQGDFPDGMEFSGLVFVGDQWFRTNPGTVESYLIIITVHEVAHQWWYARVGNDQALAPWLDEALSTYSEHIFYEEFYPERVDWWWGFRVRMFLPANFSGRRVDSAVYDFATVREYINAVYLNGATMLHQVRDVLGTEAFFAWLRRYGDVGEGRVVDADFFWGQLGLDEQNAVQSLISAFMRGR